MSHKGPDVWGNDLAELNDRIRKHQEYFEQHRQEVANNIQKDPRAHVLVRNYADSRQNEAPSAPFSALGHQTDSGNIQAVTEPELEFYGNTDTEGAAPITMADNGGIVSDGQNTDTITQKYDILVNGFHGTPEDLFTGKHPELFMQIVEHWMQLSPGPTTKFKQMVSDYADEKGMTLPQGFRLYNDIPNNAFKVQNSDWKVLFTLNDTPVAVTKHESGVDVSADWWDEDQSLKLRSGEVSEEVTLHDGRVIQLISVAPWSPWEDVKNGYRGIIVDGQRYEASAWHTTGAKTWEAYGTFVWHGKTFEFHEDGGLLGGWPTTLTEK